MPTPTKRSKPSHQKVAKRPAPRMLTRAQVRGAVQTMGMPKGTARFGSGKVLAFTAEKDPARVYPYFAQIAALLASDSKVVCWNALQIIGRLAAVDTQHQVDGVLARYLGFIGGNALISAANAIQGAGRIAGCRGDLLEQILPALLAVEAANYETAECRNVALGHVLDILAELGPGVCRRPDVAAFIHRQETNSRVAVARRASRMVAELAL